MKLESKSIQDYIYQVLFSDKKEFGTEWYFEDILETMITCFLYEGKKEMTWKSMQDVVSEQENVTWVGGGRSFGKNFHS